ncbi:hypothetical protein [Providencia stuartii]|uniref:hypothetical protein n=1 Tax=Providencia stuartii TaxID=588 RepID=UPI0034E509B1
MEFKHAPAPWMATKREFFIELYDDNGSYVGLTNSTANAHLIAAAPELLEALIELTESAKEAIDGLGDLADAIDTAKAAIAKALGQQ